MTGGFLSFTAGALAALLGLAVHRPAEFFVLLALLAAPVLFYRVMLGRRAQSRSRTRALRWRWRLWISSPVKENTPSGIAPPSPALAIKNLPAKRGLHISS